MAEREGTANEGSIESTDDLGRTVRSNHMRSNEARGTSPRRGQRSAIGTPTLLLSGAQASEQREQVERRAGGGVCVAAATPLETNEERSGAEIFVTANTEEERLAQQVRSPHAKREGGWVLLEKRRCTTERTSVAYVF